MIQFVIVMVISLYITIYTAVFGHWMQKQRLRAGALSAYVIAGITLALTGMLMWRMYLL